MHDAQSGSILVPVPACGPCVGSGSAAVASIESSDLLGVCGGGGGGARANVVHPPHPPPPPPPPPPPRAIVVHAADAAALPASGLSFEVTAVVAIGNNFIGLKEVH
jgi:hypothetical protein